MKEDYEIMIKDLKRQLSEKDDEINDVKRSLNQIMLSKNNLEVNCKKLETDLKSTREQCLILATQRNQYETLLELDENSNIQPSKDPNTSKYKLRQKMKEMKIKMESETNSNDSSFDFELCSEKIRLALLAIDGPLNQSPLRPLIDNIEKRRFMEQIGLINRIQRDRTQLGILKFYDPTVKANATRQKISEIKKAAKKSRSDRYEYSSPSLPRLSKYLTPKKRKCGDSLDGSSGTDVKLKRLESEESIDSMDFELMKSKPIDPIDEIDLI